MEETKEIVKTEETKPKKSKRKVPSFLKKKPIYIVLVVVLTLLLLLDVAIRVFVPDTSGFGNVQSMEMTSLPDAFSETEGTDSTDADSTEGSSESQSMPTDMQVSTGGFSAMTVLSFIRAQWLLLLIILAVLDVASLYMLIRIVRREKKQKKAEAKALRAAMAEGEVHIARPQKKTKQHSHYLWIIALVVIVALVGIVKILTSGTTASGTTTEATVYEEEAALGDISTVLPGTGTLVEETAVDVSLPADVEIKKWYVSNGAEVEEGDVLAAVDKVSVMTAIATVQETLTSLDEALADCEDDAISSTITAAADGRVMKVYAAADTGVVDTMYESGALLILSLDGYLAVSFETEEEISAGDSVTVTLSDGTALTGKVESMTSKTAVIVVSDEDATLGEAVTVAAEDGTVIGEGALYIHSELKVTGFTGTVSAVKVSEGDEVDAGDTLLTLTDTEYTGAYEVLLEQRAALEAQMETLFGLYQDGYVYASCSGVISGLSSTASDDDDEEADEADASATQTAATDGVVILSLCEEKTVTLTEVETTTVIGLVATVEKNEDGTVTVFWTDEAKEALTVEANAIVTCYTNGELSEIAAADIGKNDVLIVFTQETEEGTSLLQLICISTGSSQETEEENDAMPGANDQDTATEQAAQMDSGEEAQSQSGAENSGAEAMQESVAASGSTASSTELEVEAVAATYSVSETTLLSITPQDTMTVTITVDELDILSLEVGLAATVTLDAFPGQSFAGEVTAISKSGTNEGGSSKYTADITIPRESGMLSGMNASAVITLSTTENVLSIPEAALVEEDGSVYVYTTYDESTDTLGGLVEVTTGISDGENVEITSGLAEGDTYYYSILDTVNYSSSFASSATGSFSMQSLMGGSAGGRGGM